MDHGGPGGPCPRPRIVAAAGREKNTGQDGETEERNSMSKVIISCAITGSIHTPTMSPHLPWTPDQIAEQAVGAAKAGAAMLQCPARRPQTGSPPRGAQPHTPPL